MLARVFSIVAVIVCIASVAVGACKNPLPDSRWSPKTNRIQAREVHVVNVLHATVDEQRQINQALTGYCFDESDPGEFAELVRDEFQTVGFFKASVSDDIQLQNIDRSADPPSAVVIVRLDDDGDRYRLKEITFTGNKIVSNNQQLRKLFPIKDGDWFNIEAARKGIKALKDAYGNYGFINFTPVPDFTFDENAKTMSMRIDIDEGAQYFISSFQVTGADAQRKTSLESAWSTIFKPGAIYNAHAVQVYFQRVKNLLPPGATPDENLEIKQDNEKHTVDLLLNAAP